MVGAVQTFGDLIHWHSHIHAIVPDGVFTDSGYFVHIPDIWKHRAIEIWQEKVFDFLLDACKIDMEVVANIRGWKHSGFSVDNSVRIEAGDHPGMQRLVEYIARCPFSLARMIAVNDEGKVLYRATKAKCLPFPITGDADLAAGISRNYEVFDPLDFLAEVMQHIPNKGEHQIRYYGWYSNKKRGMFQGKKAAAVPGLSEADTAYRRKCRMTWAALIKCVYEVDPLKCPKCGGTMKIISFIEEDAVIRKILRHCGLWKDVPIRAPPIKIAAPLVLAERTLEYGFFENTCA
jgi:hypothetical protein